MVAKVVLHLAAERRQRPVLNHPDSAYALTEDLGNVWDSPGRR